MAITHYLAQSGEQTDRTRPNVSGYDAISVLPIDKIWQLRLLPKFTGDPFTGQGFRLHEAPTVSQALFQPKVARLIPHDVLPFSLLLYSSRILDREQIASRCNPVKRIKARLLSTRSRKNSTDGVPAVWPVMRLPVSRLNFQPFTGTRRIGPTSLLRSASLQEPTSICACP